MHIEKVAKELITGRAIEYFKEKQKYEKFNEENTYGGALYDFVQLKVKVEKFK